MKDRILIIDGHPVYIHKMEGFLRELEFVNVELARSGQEGIQKCEAERYDLIILSGRLSDMESHDVCQRIKHLNPEGRIIVQVGLFTHADKVNQFKSDGADFVLDRKEKDLNPVRLAIEELLSPTTGN